MEIIKLNAHVTGNDTSELCDLLPVLESAGYHGRLMIDGHTVRISAGRVVGITTPTGQQVDAQTAPIVLGQLLASSADWAWRRTVGAPTSYLEIPLWIALLQASQAIAA